MSDSLGPYIPTANALPGNEAPGLFSQLSNADGILGFFSLTAIGAFIATVWSIYTLLAYIAAIIFLAIYVYASIRWNQYMDIQTQEIRDMETLYNEYYRGQKKNSRLNDVYTHIDSENPNDWKLAIIEADIILDEQLKNLGHAGNSLGERLRSISPSQLQSLDAAWSAHKVRNQIAHAGADFVLTKRMADETINGYRRVFTELGMR